MLEETIAQQLPNLNNFVRECNQVFLGTSPRQEYLLDICSVTSSECINEPEGKHVGCCCGIIPAAFAFSIDGLASEGGRRLHLDDLPTRPFPETGPMPAPSPQS